MSWTLRDVMAIYSDGSQVDGENGRHRTGAGVVMYVQDAVVAQKEFPLGEQAEVFDAEMEGLARAAVLAVPFAMCQPVTIHHLVFCTDNSSAVSSITDIGPHPSQRWSILFCRAITEYLEADERNKVTIRWTPGHRGIQGNEAADCLAKAAASRFVPDTIPTYSYMRRSAKETALRAWTEIWQRTQGVDGRRRDFAVADRFAPKLRPQEHFLRITNRRVYGLVTQCRTGHAFVGEYYARFVPTEDPACPCGSGLQTRQHILLECPRYDTHRNILASVSPISQPTVGDILGTPSGIKALSRFIAKTGAFTKSGDDRFVAPNTDVYSDPQTDEPSLAHNRGQTRRRRRRPST